MCTKGCVVNNFSLQKIGLLPQGEGGLANFCFILLNPPLCTVGYFEKTKNPKKIQIAKIIGTAKMSRGMPTLAICSSTRSL